MIAVPVALRERLRRVGQEHVLASWETLDDAARHALISQLETIDLEHLLDLYEQRNQAHAAPAAHRIEPVPFVAHDASDNAEKGRVGEELLRRGAVAALVVAGGQGSRLGFEHPKGMYEVGPVSKKSLFQIHAEKVLATARRYETRLPFLVMTSPATHDETLDFFRRHAYFGLPAA